MAPKLPAVTRSALFVAAAGSLIVRTALAQNAVVIRRPEIERAGWNRVSELLEGATGWGRASVDGFSLAASPDRLAPLGLSRPGVAEWAVFVDGQPMMTELFGLHLLELLPVSIADVDSVVFVAGPAIVDGRANARGTMRLFTRRSNAGLGGELTYQHGDESGDPGPFRYTTLSSPNLEKLGPFAHASLSYGAPRFDVDAGVHYASLNVTDTLITTRFPGIFVQLPQEVVAVTPAVRAIARAHGTHELFASLGEQRGLMYIPTNAREQSLNTKLGNVSVGGRIDSLGALAVEYSGGFQRMQVDELRSPLAFTVGHERRHAYGSLQLDLQRDRLQVSAGLGADGWSATRDTLRASRFVPRAFATLAVPISRAELDVTATVTNDDPGVVPNVAARLPIRVDSLTWLTLDAATSGDNSAADGTWIDALVLAPAADAANATRAPSLRSSILRATLSRRAGYVEASIGPRAERIAISDPVAGPSAATLFGVTGHAELIGAGIMTGKFEFSHEAFVTGDANLRTRGAAVPATEARASVSATPGADFRVTGAVNLIGSSRWTFPSPLDSTRALDAITRVDASVEKWMWKRRLRLEIVVRNLLNRPERYHPQGAQWNLRSHISISLRLP